MYIFLNRTTAYYLYEFTASMWVSPQLANFKLCLNPRPEFVVSDQRWVKSSVGPWIFCLIHTAADSSVSIDYLFCKAGHVLSWISSATGVLKVYNYPGVAEV